MTRPSSLLALSRGLSIVGAGLCTGLTLSIPLWSFRAMWGIPTLTRRDRVHLWSGTFDAGAKSMVPLVLVSTTFMSIGAYKVPRQIYGSWMARNRRSVLVVGAVLMFANLPWTAGTMLKGIGELKSIEMQLVENDESSASKVDTDVLIKRWSRLHLVRVVLAALSFGVVVAEAVVV